jgi:hypothetical protein
MMVTSLLIGFCSLFFMMGHGLLVFYKSKTDPTMSLRNLFFPWPTQGRLVAFLCLSLSVTSLFFVLYWPSDLHYPVLLKEWKILITLAICPMTIYVISLIRRIHKTSGGLSYIHTPATKAEWSLPLLLVPLLTILYFFFK